MTGEKRVGDIAACRSIHHQPTAACHEKGKECGTAPLSRGHPHLTGPEHHGNEAKVGRVKEVLTAPAYDEFADNRYNCGQHDEGEGISAQEQAQGETRDEGTAWIIGRELP
jgi:hypothetical protein